MRQLSVEDCEVLDALIDAHTGAAQGAAPALASRRIAAGQRALDLLGMCPAENPPSDLGQRTLARIAAEEQRRRFAHQISTLAGGAVRDAGRFQIGRWLEIAVGAAMILVGISLALPVLDHNRAEARRIGCATNLGLAAMGFGAYAADHDNRLPRVDGVKPGEVWIRVGQPGPQGQIQSNSAHMYVLVRDGYVRLGTLACPENGQAVRVSSPNMNDWPNPSAPSYSYQNQNGPYQLRLDQGHQAVLADRNPLFVVMNGQLVQSLDVDPTSASRQHAARGQNILSADGAVRWRLSPVLPGADNIWTAQGVDRYTGIETPENPDDSHLVP
jgi:hypothetical protein